MENPYELQAAAAIMRERADHVRRGFSAERDDTYADFQLGKAGRCYLEAARGIGPQPGGAAPPKDWPWDRSWWKPRTAEADLIRAGALFQAEYERLERLEPSRRRSQNLFQMEIFLGEVRRALAAIYRDRNEQRLSIPLEGLPAMGLPPAPRDGTLVWLLIDYRGEQGDHPLDDAEFAWTVGFNNLENDGEDEWRFAGWCWSHDHFTAGRGKVLAWKPLGFPLTPPACFRPRPVDAPAPPA